MTKNTLAQTTIVFLSLIVSAKSLDIDVQPQFVRPNEENAILTCAGGNDTEEMSDKMLSMRLLRLDNDDQWVDVAVLRFDRSIELKCVNATAVGRLGDVPDSFLVVTWPLAQEHTKGRYRCDAVSRRKSGEIITVQSRDLAISSRYSDLSFVLERLKKTEKRLVGKVNDTIRSSTKSSTVNMFSVLDANFGDLKEYVDNEKAVTFNIRRPEEEMEPIQWPEGEFTLLTTDSGCPSRPYAWIKSFIKMKAQQEDKYFPIDVPLHVAKPHKKNGFVYRQFCTLPAFTERAHPWPAGSYCLFTTRMSYCPAGFTYTAGKIKVLPDKRNYYLYYYPKEMKTSGWYEYFFLWFCCRHDGNASSPIDLPVANPFYLYRHGGKCQEVKGMDVTQDVFMVDMIMDGKYKTWDDPDSDYHPDVSFLPYKEDLCYYSKSRV